MDVGPIPTTESGGSPRSFSLHVEKPGALYRSFWLRSWPTSLNKVNDFFGDICERGSLQFFWMSGGGGGDREKVLARMKRKAYFSPGSRKGNNLFNYELYASRRTENFEGLDIAV